MGVKTDQRCHKHLIVERGLSWSNCAVRVIPFTLPVHGSPAFFWGNKHSCVLPRLTAIQTTQESDVTCKTSVAESAKSLLKRFNFHMHTRGQGGELEKYMSPK